MQQPAQVRSVADFPIRAWQNLYFYDQQQELRLQTSKSRRNTIKRVDLYLPQPPLDTKKNHCVASARGTSNTLKWQTYNHSSCRTPHLQVSHLNPHPHLIHLYLLDHRHPRHQPSSQPTMPDEVRHPHLSQASHPDP